MKALCWILILGLSACQEHKQTSENTPDAVRDLLIDRVFWKKKAVVHPQDKPINIHRFTITNTSHSYAYHHIKIRFDYYDRDHRKVDSSVRIIDRKVEPRAAITIDPIEADLMKEGTATATTTVVNASAD